MAVNLNTYGQSSLANIYSRYNTTANTAQGQNANSSLISFKSGNVPNNLETNKTEEKHNGIKGFLLGAAVVGAAFLLTRGKVKPTSMKPRVLKTDKLFNMEHVRNYANSVKKYSGNAVDRIDFIKGNEFAKFIKNNKDYVNLNEELEAFSSLTEKEIVAVAAKGDNPLFTTVFSSAGLDKDVIAAFRNEAMLRVSL